MHPRVAIWLNAALVVAGCRGGPPAPGAPPNDHEGVWLTSGQVSEAKIQIDEVDARDVEDSIFAGGRVALDDLRAGHVFSPVTGRVVRIDPTFAQLGARLKRGDPLAVIESPDIGSALSDLQKAVAGLVAAQHEYDRKKSLFDARAASAADLEASDDALHQARAEVDRARQKVDLLRAGGVDWVSQTYRVRSPIDGELLLRQINPGMEVQGQYSGGTTQELFTVGNLDSVWVLADVYEMDLPRVHVGSPARVSVVAYPGRVFDGSIDWVSGTIDPGSRTAKVRAVLGNTERLLRPEMYATVEITVTRRMALAVPRSALLKLGLDEVVFVVASEDSGRFEFRRVTVSADEGTSNPWVEVTRGLEVGQRIVASGAILLTQPL
jgi:cobalt-zinc-cadmium efflux system membrane fusion protein